MDPAQPAEALREKLLALRNAAGRPSIREISKATGIPRSTISDWLRGDRLPTPWERFATLVTRLGGDPSQLRALWQAAHQATYGSRTQQADEPSEPPVTATSQRGTFTRSRRRLLIIGAAGVVVVVVVSLVVTLAVSRTPGPGSTTSVGCAQVIRPNAGVFIAPGDRRPLVVKHPGERITFPLDQEDAFDAEGRRYRAVRTPTRTESGIAWMRADTLVNIDC
jgi:transcriptional regulator with XRE-family HTH domain